MVSSVAAVLSILESSRREAGKQAAAAREERMRRGLLLLLDSSCFGHFLLLLLLPFIATSYQSYSYQLLPRRSVSHRLLSLSSLPPCHAFCLCNAGIAASRSIWVSFIHVHLVHAHTWDCYQSEAVSVPLLTMKCMASLDLQADLTPLMRRLGM